jgi:hypothetical protein
LRRSNNAACTAPSARTVAQPNAVYTHERHRGARRRQRISRERPRKPSLTRRDRLLVAHVLHGLVRRCGSPIWPGAGLVLRLLDGDRFDDLIERMASTPCPVQSEGRNVNPFRRVGFDLGKFPADVVDDPFCTSAGPQCPGAPIALSLQTRSEIEHRVVVPLRRRCRTTPVHSHRRSTANGLGGRTSRDAAQDRRLRHADKIDQACASAHVEMRR